eukprot:scaffold100167_cov65-Phaeocystis_antarctica.AAC.3
MTLYRLPYATGDGGSLRCRSAAARNVRQMRLVLAVKRGERCRTALPSAPRPWLKSIVYAVAASADQPARWAHLVKVRLRLRRRLGIGSASGSAQLGPAPDRVCEEAEHRLRLDCAQCARREGEELLWEVASVRGQPLSCRQPRLLGAEWWPLPAPSAQRVGKRHAADAALEPLVSPQRPEHARVRRRRRRVRSAGGRGELGEASQPEAHAG